MKLEDLKEAKQSSKELEYYANKDNWPSDLEKAKEFAKGALKKWKWKEKAPKFISKIENASSVSKVQELVLNTMLSGEGLGVTK